jgi:hypothetical protein
MAKKEPAGTETTELSPDTETEPTPALKSLVAVRLAPDAPYGRVMVGAVIVEHASIAHIPAEEFERLGNEYGLEKVE